MADHDLNRWMRGVESEAPPELWTDISHRTPRRRPPRQTPRAVRYAGIALISAVVAAGIILPLKALLPLADRDKPAANPAAPGTTSAGADLNGRIAFVSPVNGWSSTEISSMNPDGTDVRTLVGSDDLGKGPVGGMDWSPDGKWLAFAADWPDYHVYLVRDDGSGLHSITGIGTVDDPAPSASSPTWSPDGTQIAYLARGGITIVDQDGGDPQEIDPGVSNYADLDWSPDGTRFTFYGDGIDLTQKWDIYTINVDGTGLTNLTRDDHINLDPRWSPDGSKILFRSRRSGDEVGGWTEGTPAPDEIYTMNPDGTDITRLTNNDGIDQRPVWSPDGTQIVYDCQDMGVDVPMTICVMNADGTGLVKLPVEGAAPAWAPSTDEPTCPTEIAVPDITGMSLGDAKTALNNSALVLGELHVGLGGAPGPSVVVSQDPAPGTNATCGQAVSVVVGGPADPSGPRTLQGVTWTPVTINGEQPILPAPEVRFADGNVEGNTGCNDFGTPYSIEGDQITFKGGAMHQVGCEPANAAQEAAFMSVFRGTATFNIDGGTFTLSSSEGEVVFARVPND